MRDGRRIAPLLLALGVLAVLGVVLLRGGGDGYRVQIVLDDAAGLVEAAEVKVGGVPAGEIAELELNGDDRAEAEVELSHDAGPIGPDATARVRPVTLLGEKYVDLDPGDTSRPQPSGTVIPAERTSEAVELDDLINTLDSPTRAALRILINEAGVAMRGRGADFNRLLAELPPALDRTGALLAEIGAENAALRRLIAKGDRVIGSVAGRRDELGELVDTAQQALRATAERRAELGATVRAAPSTLKQLTRTLAHLDGAASKLTPVAVSLRRSAPALASTLEEAPEFEQAIRGGLREAEEAAPSLLELASAAGPTVTRVRPTTRLLDDLAAELSPVVIDTLDRYGGFQWLLTLADNWGNATRRKDAVGHWFQGNAWLDRSMFTRVLDLLTAGDRRKRHAGSGPRTSAYAAPAPAPAPEVLGAPKLKDRLSKLKGALPGIKLPDRGLEGLLGSPDEGSGSAGQIDDVLDFLLGP